MKVGDRVRLKDADKEPDNFYVFSWEEYLRLKDRVLVISSLTKLLGEEYSVQFKYPDDLVEYAPFKGSSFHYSSSTIEKVLSVATKMI